MIDKATGKKRKIRNKRYPVITLVLYFGKTPWKKPLCLYDVIDVPEFLKPFVNDFKINIIDVPRLTPEQVKKYKGDFQIIADYFVQLNSGKRYIPSNKKMQHPDSLLKLMSVLTKDIRYAECVGNTASETEGTTMCEVLDRIEARGIEKTKTEMVLNMLKENLSVEMIARIAKLTVDQVMAIGKKAAVL